MLKKSVHGDIVQFRAARTILRRPLYYNHFYYVDGMLIDTGPPHVSTEAMAEVRKYDVSIAVLTHHHEDHTGGCHLLQSKYGIPIYARPETIKAMQNQPPLKIYRKVMWGEPKPAKVLPLEHVVKTPRHRFEIIFTPGHSIDHVCFFEPQKKWLFSGDLYLGEKLTGFMEGENIIDHLASLQRAITLKPNLLFCGLKGRLEDATVKLVRKYEYWWELGCRVANMCEAGAGRKEILQSLFGGEVFFYHLSQHNWGRLHLLNSMIANKAFFQKNKTAVTRTTAYK